MKFIAVDGKEFNNYEEACAYEYNLRNEAILENMYSKVRNALADGILTVSLAVSCKTRKCLGKLIVYNEAGVSIELSDLLADKLFGSRLVIDKSFKVKTNYNLLCVHSGCKDELTTIIKCMFYATDCSYVIEDNIIVITLMTSDYPYYIVFPNNSAGKRGINRLFGMDSLFGIKLP